MYKTIKILLFFVLLGTVFSACRKVDAYPDIPEITFTSFEKYGYISSTGTQLDTALYMNIEFTDGDGDIGFLGEPTVPDTDPHYYDLIVQNYIYRNGTYVLRKLDIPFSARIPNLTPEGIHKSIKGSIRQQLRIKNDTVNFDTLRFEVFIYDRAFHKSNVITSPDVIINRKDK